MKKKIIKSTFWSGAGVALASLIGSLSLVAIAPGSNITKLTPPQESKHLSLQNWTPSDKNIRPEHRPHSNDLVIERYDGVYDGWQVTKLTEQGKQKNHIDIPNGIIVIAADAFQDDVNLETINIPDSVVWIRYGAFKNCSNLQAITIPPSVEKIDGEILGGCDKLTENSVANYSPVLFDWWVLHKMCSGSNPQKYINIKQLDLNYAYNTNWQTFTVVGTGAFENDSNLEQIVDFGSITTIDDYAFAHCSNLQSTPVSSKITTFGSWVFSSCSNLKSVTIPETTIKMGETVFYGCSKVTITNNSRVLFDWWVQNYQMPDLGNVTVKNYIDNKKTIEPDVFEHKVVDSKGESFTTLGSSAFYTCELHKIVFPDTITDIGERAFVDHWGVTSITLPKHLTEIGFDAFTNCRDLADIVIPDSEKKLVDMHLVLYLTLVQLLYRKILR